MTRDELRALLGELWDRPPPAAWHPTGFVVLELHRDARGALRLHLWPPAGREQGRPCWPVHDHVWHLSSRVLCGAVHSHGYAVEDEPEGDALLYAVEYGRERRSCMRRSERRVSVHACTPQRTEAGGRYAVPAGEFHASRVEAGELAATLVLTTRTERAHPWVVGPADGPALVPVLRPSVSEARVRSMLDEVDAALV
ncbi:MAG: hypothetical protein H6712_12525 [Myxococcales bacterium]|nr:hypothetical protein [Myxococcales bacterium]MCB9714682.1 hypothetical protein [Myxococcales bacterium]